METRPVRPTKLDIKPADSRRYHTESESASSVGDSDQAKPFQDSNTGMVPVSGMQVQLSIYINI